MKSSRIAVLLWILVHLLLRLSTTHNRYRISERERKALAAGELRVSYDNDPLEIAHSWKPVQWKIGDSTGVTCENVPDSERGKIIGLLTK